MRLFAKIKDSMPPGNRNLNISDQDYIALVSYILQSNAFPPHRDDNPLTASLLDLAGVVRRLTVAGHCDEQRSLTRDATT